MEKQLDAQGNGYFYETPLRQYDPQLGRFGGVDLLAEEYATLSPHQYGANNPILFSDPTGARLDSDCADCWGIYTGGGGLDRFSGRIRINTIGGTYTTSSGNTYGGGSGYSYGGGGYTSLYGTGYDRMDAMYWESKRQTFAEAYGIDGSDLSFFNDGNTKLLRSVTIGETYSDNQWLQKCIDEYWASLEGEKSWADNVGLAGTIGGTIGGGAKNILDNRGAYMPRGKIYRMNKEITIRTPVVNINTTSKVLNYARVGGKVLGVAGVFATGYQIYGDAENGFPRRSGSPAG